MAEPAHRIVDEPLAGKAAKPTPVILLVDDDEITRISMAGRLKRLGYRVIEADDGVAGLAAIRAQRPDLVILDWMMPGLDGPSVCEAIRADGELRSSQVVLMTAHDQPEQIAEGLSRGADDFLSKAASKQEVLARVQASLRSNALVREIERTRDDLDRSHRLLSAKQAELESELQSAADFVRAQLPLPGMPAPGVSMQWAYQPSLALGGDLFQVSAWGSETLGLYILDASGHGVAAALRAVALMSFLREDNLAKAVGSSGGYHHGSEPSVSADPGRGIFHPVGRASASSVADLIVCGSGALRRVSPFPPRGLAMVVFGEPAARVRPGDLVRQYDRTIAASGSSVSSE